MKYSIPRLISLTVTAPTSGNCWNGSGANPDGVYCLQGTTPPPSPCTAGGAALATCTVGTAAGTGIASCNVGPNADTGCGTGNSAGP